MNNALITFTKQGAYTCGKAVKILEKQGHSCRGYKKGSFEDDSGLEPVAESLQDWAGQQFCGMDALIFIGAAGIAVRAVAPFVKSKTTDPACITIDERGTWVIPFLSGHIGGANDLARLIAAEIGAEPVITTATDLNGLFAVDEWARKNNMHISDMKLAKKIASDLLQDKKIRIKSYFLLKEPLPKGVTWADADHEVDLELSIAPTPDSRGALHLIPRCVYLGIGCRKGASREAIEDLVTETLRDVGISMNAVAGVASIDLKAEEAGLVEFCRGRKLPFQVFTAKQLAEAPGEFSGSSFVSSVTGVDNVCERAAVLAGEGKLIIKKQAKNGVTVAAAIQEKTYGF